MVSLLISELGKAISGHTPEAMYDVLGRQGYLSESGLAQRAAVVELATRVHEHWPTDPAPGREPWREVQAALAERGFLSPAGLGATERYVSRR